jgi:Cu(I)/Ag(I) efflux system membrane protein CusA/SilA
MGTKFTRPSSKTSTNSHEAIREAVVKAGKKRVRPAAMTTATTLIALHARALRRQVKALTSWCP